MLLETAHPIIGISIGVFVVGHVVGTVLFGIALLRSRRIPAWSLTADGMAMVARALLRETPPER